VKEAIEISKELDHTYSLEKSSLYLPPE